MKWHSLEYFVIGIVILSNFYILIDKTSAKELRLLSLLGLIMLFTYPVGSAGGLYSAGRFALWISVPIGIEVISRFRNLNVSFFFGDQKQQNITIGADQMKIFPKLFICPVIISGVLFAFSHPYFDKGSRFEMVHSVNHKNLRGIFTTKERAASINELLIASDMYVKPGDFVLAFDNIPMYYYLTNTIPYLSNPQPGQYPAEMFKRDLHNSLERSKELPIIILQKVNTLNSDWPNNSDEPYLEKISDKKRTQYFLKFVNDFHYEVIWENNSFKIMKTSYDDNTLLW